MSVPAEYTDARNSLIALRKKVFEDLVSGRVKAGLDAGHAGMQKFSSVVQQLSITPTLIGKIREKGLALKLGTQSLGDGQISQAKTIFTGTKFPYPMTTPHAVPLRSLPEVDVFRYTPVTDIGLIEKSSEEIWRTLFLVQAERNYFREEPNMTNVTYDFYSMRPVGRYDCVVTLSGQETGFGSYETIKGEATFLVVELTKAGETIFREYSFYCFVDVEVFSSTDKIATLPVLLLVPSETAGQPQATVVCAGKHILTDSVSVYAGFVEQGQLVGWGKIATGLTFVTKNVVFAGSSVLEIAVNDTDMGTTDPVPDIYNHKTLDEVTVDALPNAGYGVDHWELDGVDFGTGASFTVKMYKDRSLLCVFVVSTSATIRPNAVGDVTELWARPDTLANWDCLNEEVADDHLSYVRSRDFLQWDGRDLYHLSGVTVPSGKTVTRIRVIVKAKSESDLNKNDMWIRLKTSGVEYQSDPFYPIKAWGVYERVWEKNPYTGNNWTEAELNALQVGIRMFTKYDAVLEKTLHGDCTQLYVIVEWD